MVMFTQRQKYIGVFDVDYVLADKGYDSDQFVEVLEEAGAIVNTATERPQEATRI